MRQAHLYILVDQCAAEEAFISLVRLLVDAGVDILQLRAKRLSDRDLLARARLLRELTRQTGSLFIVNDRPDLAVLAEADGVHLGQDDLAVADARRIVGEDMLIGVSTHSLVQARQATSAGASYIGCGPTFPSTTKRFDTYPGLDFLRAVSELSTPPAFAIGGINGENLRLVLEAGIRRIAVSGGVVNARDPAGMVRKLKADIAAFLQSSPAQSKPFAVSESDD